MKKLLIWLMVAFILQFGVWEYLNRVVLAPAAGFSQETVGGQPATYSYDKDFYAQMSSRDLKIYATAGHRLVRDITLAPKENLTYFTWLPNRNLALAGTSTYTAHLTTVALMSIDPETESEPASPKIYGLPKGAAITGTAYSTMTNVTNILVTDRYGTAVYRTDANNYLRLLHLGTSHIDRIASLRDQDVLLYDDSATSSVWAYYGKGRRSRVFPGLPCTLVGTDKNDNVYLGALTRGKMVSTIYRGKLGGRFTVIDKPDSPYPVGSVHVTYDGRLTFS